MSEPNFKVKIPNIMNPFTVEVNGKRYSFPAGTTQMVNQKVYDVIRNIESMVPTPNPRAGEPSFESLRDKPFGYSTEVLFDQRVEFVEVDGMIGNTMDVALNLNVGEEYVVTYNGNKYTCKAINAGDFPEAVPTIGNFWAFGGDDTGEPFVISVYEDLENQTGLRVDIADLVGNTSATVKIEKSVIHPIDPKFLPEMSSYCHVNIWYDENDGEYKSDKTYDDIKAAEAAKTPVIGTLAVPSGNVYTLVGCDAALPSAYLVAFDLFNLPTTLKVFCASIGENNNVSVLASNFSGTATDV